MDGAGAEEDKEGADAAVAVDSAAVGADVASDEEADSAFDTEGIPVVEVESDEWTGAPEPPGAAFAALSRLPALLGSAVLCGYAGAAGTGAATSLICACGSMAKRPWGCVASPSSLLWRSCSLVEPKTKFGMHRSQEPKYLCIKSQLKHMRKTRLHMIPSFQGIRRSGS
jgi:hypothetical protein